MRLTILAAVLLSLSIVAAAALLSGRYRLVQVSGTEETHRIDRWTGDVAICRIWDGGTPACATAVELRHDGKTALPHVSDGAPGNSANPLD